jgi:hypothetical protein
MLLLSIVATILATTVWNVAGQEPTTPPADENCHPTLHVGHVPGRMDKVWTLTCD